MNSVGKNGENIAYNYLTKNGYNILEQNFKVIFGEIDIIAEKKNCISFIEVKSRMSKKYGLPEEAITIKKKNKIIKVAEYYIKKRRIKNKLYCFDVISIYFEKNILKELRHIKNAFNQ
mgnify:CR=1 FL=1